VTKQSVFIKSRLGSIIEVFKMLKAEGKINDVVIENMMNWHHSGFNVYCGKAIWPHNESAGGGENLARGTCPP